MFWALTLYSFYQAVFYNKLRWLYLSAIFAGLALLSKYTAILIFPSLLLFLLTTKYYKFLYKKDLYLAFLVTLLLFSPVILWNYQHHWVSFLFQLHHGISSSFQISFANISDYLLSTTFGLGPFIFIGLIYYFITNLSHNFKNTNLNFLICNYLVIILTFTYFSLFKKVEGNWTAPAYLSAIIFVAYYLQLNHNKWISIASLMFIALVIAVAKFPLVLIPSKYKTQIPIMNEFYGTKELIMSIKPYLTKNTLITACDYGNASRVWFYLDYSQVTVLPNFKFAMTYPYFNNHKPLKDYNNILYVCDHKDLDTQLSLHNDFKNINLLKEVSFSNKLVSKTEYIYNVSN
jgi:hypothetical protein